MKSCKVLLFFALVALLSGCATDIIFPCRQTYGVTHDSNCCKDFPVSYREVGEDYHTSHTEWVYQPHVIIPEPPVVIHAR